MSADARPPEGGAPLPRGGGREATGGPTRPLLTLQGVHTHVGAYHLLHGVDLDVPAGQVTMLLGRNGAGKTSTLRTLMGLWPPSAGSVRFKGEDITTLATPEIASRGIAYVPETMGIFGALTVAENLLLAARSAKRLADLDTARLEGLFGLFPALKTFWQRPAGTLSGGQKQMVAIARALIEPRELLVIDEPSKGLAPAIVENLISALRALKQSSQTTVLLVEQNFRVAAALGDTVAVMDDGRVVHRGAMAELIADGELQQRLLGLSLGAHQ